MQLGEDVLLEPVQRLRELSDRAEVARARAACRAHELDRQVEQSLEPLADELGHLAAELDRNAALDRKPAEADRGTAKPVRVARARRLEPARERGLQVVELVRRGQDPARLRVGQRRLGAVGQVLLLDCPAHRFGPPCQARVLGADVALELRELPHQLRRLVGLRELRRLPSRVAAAELLDERHEPFRLVRERAGAG